MEKRSAKKRRHEPPGVKDRNGGRAFADPSRNLGSKHSQGEFLVTPNETKVLPVVREQCGADLPDAQGDQDIIEQRRQLRSPAALAPLQTEILTPSHVLAGREGFEDLLKGP
jgi:hypothetical protein